MEEEQKNLPKEKEKPKSQWQRTKEGWYDKIPLTLKQLDMIIALGIIGMIVLAIVIALDALGVF